MNKNDECSYSYYIMISYSFSHILMYNIMQTSMKSTFIVTALFLVLSREGFTQHDDFLQVSRS